MTEEVLWEGKIKLLRIQEGDTEILRWDDEGLYEGFEEAMRRLKHKSGENMMKAMIFGLVGLAEMWKVWLLFKADEL